MDTIITVVTAGTTFNSKHFSDKSYADSNGKKSPKLRLHEFHGGLNSSGNLFLN